LRGTGAAFTEKQKGAYIKEVVVFWQPLNGANQKIT
jgi:hypothetical protein